MGRSYEAESRDAKSPEKRTAHGEVREDHEYDHLDRLLDQAELAEFKLPLADAIRRHLKNVIEEGDAPTREGHPHRNLTRSGRWPDWAYIIEMLERIETPIVEAQTRRRGA